MTDYCGNDLGFLVSDWKRKCDGLNHPIFHTKINSFTPKILLIAFVSHKILLIVVGTIWYWIN